MKISSWNVCLGLATKKEIVSRVIEEFVKIKTIGAILPNEDYILRSRKTKLKGRPLKGTT